MLIITSVGRCGSSVLTSYFKALGLDIGRVRWIKHLDAGMECQRTVNINNILLRDGLNKSVITKIKELPNDICKDPQFLISPELIRAWLTCRNDIEILFLRRDPKKIVESLKRHPMMNSPVYRNHTDLIIQHEQAFLDTIKDLKLPISQMWFPEFIDQFEDIYQFIIDRFDIDQSKNACKVKFNAVIDKDKVHV